MLRLRVVLVAGIAAAGMSLIGGGPGMAADSAKNAASAVEITALEKRYQDILNSPEWPKNPAILHAFFAPGFTMNDIERPGRFEDGVKHYDDLATMFFGTSEFKDMRVHVNGDLGYVTYVQYFTGRSPKGQPVVANLYLTDVWEKQNGRWLMVHQQATLPLDSAALTSAMMPKDK